MDVINRVTRVFHSSKEIPFDDSSRIILMSDCHRGDGSCVHPRCITGIEIVDGNIMLIKWCTKAKDDGTLFIRRDVIAGPRKLKEFFSKISEKNK